MYIRKIEAMNIPFTFQTAHAMADEAALLDSGATENFIDTETWKRMGIRKKPLVKPIKVYNVDGTEDKQGEMMHYCQLRIIYNGEEDLQNFYLTSLGKDRIILGYPFMSCFNPRVNWRKGSLSKGKVVIQSAVFKHLDQMVTNWQAKAQRQLGDPEHEEAIYVRKATISQRMAHDYQRTKPKIDISIPPEFQRYAKVFSEEEARKFLPDRNPNAVIELLPGTPEQLNCKVYPLTRQETETLKKFLSEEIDKGYIEETASPYMLPVFFINKKDSAEKRLVVDYW